MAIVFYAKQGCTYCDKLETLLKSINVPYDKIYLNNIDDITRVKQKTSMKTFPMILIGNEVVGGFKEFNTLYITNQLAKKLIPYGINLEDW
jgi:glutaredoxin